MIVVAIILALIVAFLLLGFIISLLTKLAILLLVALLAGFIARSVLKYNSSLQFTFLSGLAGAAVGWIIQAILGAPSLIKIGGLPVLWTFVGAMIVVAVAKVVEPGRRRV